MTSDLIIPAHSKPNGIRTYEIVVYITGYLEGGLNDWPANIQDAIYAALERKAAEVQLPLAIVQADCIVDPPMEEGGVDRFLLHIIASEIVVGDSRFIRDTKEQMQAAFADLLAGRPLQ